MSDLQDIKAYLIANDLIDDYELKLFRWNDADLGNNTNWQIETTGGIDLYWVNGSGNWDDPNHWDY